MGISNKTVALVVLCAATVASWSSWAGDVRQPAQRSARVRGGGATCGTDLGQKPAALLDCVTADGVARHLVAFQEHADAGGGTRVAGSPGHEASLSYVAHLLEQAGYAVTLHAVEFDGWRPLGPSSVEPVVPAGEAWPTDEFYPMLFSEPGEVFSGVAVIDPAFDDPASSTSGCDDEDFVGFRQGSIALIQRGTCGFREKAERAAAAGAAAVILFNQGHLDHRLDAFPGTLTDGYHGGIPVLTTSFARGKALAEAESPVLRISLDVRRGPTVTYNLIADSPHGSDDHVVMLGAHLDSVPYGPGIQDNGSGSAALLEVALQLRGVQTTNRLRFAWWGAEEFGLLGSTAWVDSLPADERSRIALYLNLDMVASPNGGRFILDGDGARFGLSGPPGSDEIAEKFRGFFEDRALAHEPTDIGFRSDYAPFFEAGIPFGGLFAGSGGVKSNAQAIRYGGEAGEPFDACYHRGCDTVDNVDREALELSAEAAAFVALHYGREPEPLAAAAGKSYRFPLKFPGDGHGAEGCYPHE